MIYLEHDCFICPRDQELRHTTTSKEGKTGMRYTHHRGLARVSAWVRLKFVAMNLKKLALCLGKSLDFSYLLDLNVF